MRKAGFIISDKSNCCVKSFFYDLWRISGKKISIQKIKEQDDKRRKWVVYIL